VARHGHLIALHAPSTSPFGEGVDISAAALLADVAGHLVNREVSLVDPHTAVCVCGNVAVLFVVNPKPFGAHQRAGVFATAERIGVLMAEYDILREPWTVETLANLLDQHQK